MAVIVVTGTNTDVGKTIATAAVASVLASRGLDVVCAKPLQTGEPDGSGDAVTITRLTGLPTAEFVRYPEPLAPNLSARRAGMPQAVLAEVADWVRELERQYDVVLVEGAGGLLVRLADDWTLADLALELAAPLLVVTSTGLGSLNLAELTVETGRSRGLQMLGLLGGSWPQEPDLATRLNADELPVVCGVPLLGVLPQGAGALERADFVRMADGMGLPDLV
ncbi:dethiobiotin synthase [Luteococcus sp.]|uniref:dethiobiotin synthase n=1 Tax=Luteococcus sp. TaxID=1969402 RepID=UPI0037353A1E